MKFQREHRDRRAASPAFTIIEMMVVIGIISLLIAILLPTVRTARRHARLTTCVSIVRSQALMLTMYTDDHLGRLPPRVVWRTDSEGMTHVSLINKLLADYSGYPFVQNGPAGWKRPEGIWRCVDVGPNDDRFRLSHSGIIHFAPNTWLFNLVSILDYAVVTRRVIWASAYAGWEDRYATSEWRRIERVPRAERIISLLDNVNFYNGAHGHREARESFGLSCEVVSEPCPCNQDSQGSHDAVRRRPAAFLDGHAVALPSTRDYWMSSAERYRPPGARAGERGAKLFAREVDHFLWYIGPSDNSFGGREP
jgi:prepilin-type N-terminal cleavage/methylation domain-containing protein